MQIVLGLQFLGFCELQRVSLLLISCARGVSFLGLIAGRVQVDEEAREKCWCIGSCFGVIGLRGH